MEYVAGWSIGPNGRMHENGEDRVRDAGYLYHKLEHRILPMFYRDRENYITIMKQCIALNASFFNTQRMVKEYVTNTYMAD